MNARELETQHNLKKWAAIIKECRSSGMKILQWLEINNISKDQYYYWQRKLKETCIDTLERQKIIRDMRLDGFDVLVGINLLREGLDIPEISLVAILDADKEGFLRTETSLIQTIGRAARNAEGHVIMYADTITESMEKAISETERRRKIQQEYNEAHGITPQTIKKAVRDLISISKAADADSSNGKLDVDYESMSIKDLEKVKKQIEKNMRKAAAELDFEQAAMLRDKMIEINKYIYEDKKSGK